MTAERLAHAMAVRASIIALGLKRHPKFDSVPPDEFAAIYNGIGPDSWPEAARDTMTAVYSDLEELPGVHDVDFYFSDGTRASFDATLYRWKHNSRVLVNHKYPLWKCVLSRRTFDNRVIAMAKAEMAYVALVKFSWPIYVDAYKRRTTHLEQDALPL